MLKVSYCSNMEFYIGEDRRVIYENDGLVILAEKFLSCSKPQNPYICRPAGQFAKVEAIAPILRARLLMLLLMTGAVSLEFRNTPHVMNWQNGNQVSRYATTGPVTPDHVIRTKPKPLIIATPKEIELRHFRWRQDRRSKNIRPIMCDTSIETMQM